MAKQREEHITRRLGRVEMLLNELEQLSDGYQPTEREVEQFGKLASKIDKAFDTGAVWVNPEYEAAIAKIAELRDQVAALEAELAKKIKKS